jgi:hypothetical protein
MANSELLQKIILRSRLKEIEVKNLQLEMVDTETSKFFNSLTIVYKVTKLPKTYFFSSSDIIEEIEARIDPILKSTVRDAWLVIKLQIDDEYIVGSNPKIFVSDNVLKYIETNLKSINHFTFSDLDLDVSNLSYRLAISGHGMIFLDIYFKTDSRYDSEYFNDPFYAGEVKELAPIEKIFESVGRYQILLYPESK